jgi:ribosomal protein S18 acetylase RimI-like enzyme
VNAAVTRFDTGDHEALDALAGSLSVLPRDCLPASRDRLEAYWKRSVLAAAGGAPAVRVETGGGVTGLAVYRHLDWDTDVLGIPAGRVSVAAVGGGPARERRIAARALAARMVETAREMGDVHVSVRLDAREPPVIQGFEGAGFETVDAILTLIRDLDREELDPVEEGAARDAVEADIPALRSLAASGFVYDRFHNDPTLGAGAADALHAAWVENAVRGNTGCGVLVAESGGAPAGFFILGEDSAARDTLGFGVGTLVLITVGAAYRRRGLAHVLSVASARRLHDRGNRFVEVGTQLANVPASAVYLASGFRLASTGVSLRWAAAGGEGSA